SARTCVPPRPVKHGGPARRLTAPGSVRRAEHPVDGRLELAGRVGVAAGGARDAVEPVLPGDAPGVDGVDHVDGDVAGRGRVPAATGGRRAARVRRARARRGWVPDPLPQVLAERCGELPGYTVAGTAPAG